VQVSRLIAGWWGAAAGRPAARGSPVEAPVVPVAPSSARYARNVSRAGAVGGVAVRRRGGESVWALEPRWPVAARRGVVVIGGRSTTTIELRMRGLIFLLADSQSRARSSGQPAPRGPRHRLRRAL
jgi:hypothetical protein